MNNRHYKCCFLFVVVLLFHFFLTSAQIRKFSSSDSSIKKEIKPLQKKDTTSLPIKLSKDKINTPVNYTATDSIVYDVKKRELILYKKAIIKYEDKEINAGKIIYSQDSSLLYAEYENDIVDTQKNILKQGNDFSNFTKLKYNFNTQKAILLNGFSQYGEGYIHSQQIKRNKDESIYGYKNLYTTCSLDTPHFGISAKRVKIIPNKVAVSGAANLIIENIPTPLFLPFGLFPLKQGQRSGFKLPTYDVSEQLGFGLREGGYYVAVNDHLDFLALADIYTLGTWRAGFSSNYNWRYRFMGNMSFNYSYTKIGEQYEAGSTQNRSFFVTWNHSIDSKVIPGTTLNANVNVGSSRYHTDNSYDANFYLNNTYNSNISYSKTWKDKPYNLSVNARHSQNTSTKLVQVRLPEINFSVSQFNPFQFRKNIIKPYWYEKISSSYQVSAINEIQFYDTSFQFSNLHLSDFKNGIKHTLPLGASYQIIKYLNFSPSFNYAEFWYSTKSFKYYNYAKHKLDTILNNGITTAREYSFNAGLSTRIYGIKLFKHSAIVGIRHVLIPSINFSYHPDFGRGIYNYYYDTFLDSVYNKQRLSYFDGSIIGQPSDGKFGGINFNIGNTLQLKVRSKKDTINGSRKINILDGLNIGGSYNLAVDSLKWSRITVSYRTTLFETVQLSGGMVYDPYVLAPITHRRINKYMLYEHGKPLRFEQASVALGASLPLKKNTMATPLSEEQRALVGDLNQYADFNIPWTLNVNYSISFQKTFSGLTQLDTLLINQDLNFYGDINLTPKWKIGIRSGYDFIYKKLNYTSIDVYRDLHCWEIKLNAIPFGYRKSYNFSLNVKASVLQDLKLVRRKDFRDF